MRAYSITTVTLALGLAFILYFPLPLTFFMKLATISYCAMLAGFLIRKKNTKLHIVLMLFAMLVDLSLVLILEFQRHAIEKAVSFTLSPLQQLHILHSSIALICYFPIVWLGYKNYLIFSKKINPNPKIQKWHRNLGFITFYFRTAGFLLMFSMIK